MPATPHAIVVMGVAGSGKGTVARALATHYGDVFLDAAPEVIAARLAARRDHFMSPRLLASQLHDLQLPTAELDVVTLDVDRPLGQILDEAIATLKAM